MLVLVLDQDVCVMYTDVDIRNVEINKKEEKFTAYWTAFEMCISSCYDLLIR